MPRLARPFVLSALALGLVPAVAHGKTFCVGTPGGSCDGGSYPFDKTGLSDAINDANGIAGAQTVRIGAGTISDVGTTDLNGHAVLVGAGRDQTILESAQVNGTAFRATGPNNGFTDLTLRTTKITSSGGVAKILSGATFERVAAVEASPAANSQPVLAVNLVDTSATDLTVTVNSVNDQGLELDGSGSLSDVAISGPGINGILVSATGAIHTFDRVSVRGFDRGISIFGVLGLFLRDSLIDLGGRTGARGLIVESASAAGDNEVSFIRGSIVGRGPNQTAVEVRTTTAGETPSVLLSDSLVDLQSTTPNLTCTVSGAGSPDLNTARTAFRTQQRDAGCAGSATSILNLATNPPRYRDAAVGDYRPAWNSPVVDAGGNSSPTQTLDLAGAKRFVDGNGTGGGALDLGAYEYQRGTPTSPAIALPTGAAATVEAAFTASSTDPDGDPLTYTWAFGDGTTGTGAATTHAYGAPGSYAVKLTVSDPTGRTATSTANLSVAAAPPAPTAAPTPAPTAGPASGSPTSETAQATPTVRLVKGPSRILKRSKAGFSLATKPTPAAASLSVTGATSLRLSLTRLAAGRRAGTRCTTTAKRGARCTVRTSIKGTATLPTRGGSVALAFGGTFAGKRLAAGRYEVKVEPVSAGGAVGSTATYRVTLR